MRESAEKWSSPLLKRLSVPRATLVLLPSATSGEVENSTRTRVLFESRQLAHDGGAVEPDVLPADQPVTELEHMQCAESDSAPVAR
jgi:hypothetical protein